MTDLWTPITWSDGVAKFTPLVREMRLNVATRTLLMKMVPVHQASGMGDLLGGVPLVEDAVLPDGGVLVLYTDGTLEYVSITGTRS